MSKKEISGTRISKTLVLAVLAFLLPALNAAAEGLTVNVNVANVRSGPGTEYDTIWQVEKYHPLQIVEKAGKWYRFKDFEGDEGWIHKSTLADFKAVITNKDKCNVRSGPGMQNDIVFIVEEKGIPFKVLEKRDRWIHIQHADGDKGWIHQSLVWSPAS